MDLCVKSIIKDPSIPKLIPNYISDNNIGVSDGDILELISNLCDANLELIDSTVRLFKGTGRDRSLLEKVIQNENKPKLEHETVLDWYNDSKQNHIGEDFLLIINRVDRVGEKLLKKVVKHVTSELNQHLEGFNYEIVIFAGKYGYTPFGIHIDDGLNTVIHWHLGPGNKRLDLWHKDDYSRTKMLYPDNSYLPEGKYTSYMLEAGDAFILPASDYYHIGYTEEFSVGVAIVIEHLSPNLKASRVIDHGAKELKKLVDKHTIEGFDFNFNTCELGVLGDISVKDFLNLMRKDHNNLMQSAGEFSTAPMVPEHDNLDFSPESVFIRNHNFPIVIDENGDHLIVYIRNNKIRLNNIEQIRDLLDYIINNQRIVCADLIERFDGIFDEETLYHILGLFLQYRGLEPVINQKVETGALHSQPQY